MTDHDRNLAAGAAATRVLWIARTAFFATAVAAVIFLLALPTPRLPGSLAQTVDGSVALLPTTIASTPTNARAVIEATFKDNSEAHPKALWLRLDDEQFLSPIRQRIGRNGDAKANAWSVTAEFLLQGRSGLHHASIWLEEAHGERRPFASVLEVVIP